MVSYNVSFNSVVMAGSLTRDPELRYTATGKAICSMRLRAERTWKGADGQRHVECCLVDVEAWNRTAEIAAQFLKKGRSVLIHGRLGHEAQVDKSTGKKVDKYVVVANTVRFLPSVQKEAAEIACDDEQDAPEE